MKEDVPEADGEGGEGVVETWSATGDAGAEAAGSAVVVTVATSAAATDVAVELVAKDIVADVSFLWGSSGFWMTAVATGAEVVATPAAALSSFAS